MKPLTAIAHLLLYIAASSFRLWPAMAMLLAPTAFASSSTAGDALAGPPPVRAFLLTKAGSRIILVGESHYATQVEADEYARQVIAPAYRASGLALLENPGPSLPTALDALYLATRCGSPTVSPPSIAVNPKKTVYSAATTAALRDLTLRVHDADPHWNEYDDLLTRYSELQLNLWVIPQTGIDTWRHVAGQNDTQFRKTVESFWRGLSLQLMQQEARGQTLPEVRPIEPLADRWAAICAAPPEVRDDYIRDQVRAADRFAVALGRGPASWSSIQSNLDHSFREELACIGRRPACEFLAGDGVQLPIADGLGTSFTPAMHEIGIRNRNALWIPRLLQAAAENPRVIAVVGALHLADLVVSGTQYPGLITLLRQQGYVATAMTVGQPGTEALHP
jgi:hypothetical protein